MRCETLYNLSTIQGYQLEGLNFGQFRGTQIHNLLYLFYKSKLKKKSYNLCVSNAMRYLRLIGKTMKIEDFLLLSRKFGEYVAYYRNENIQPLAVEKGFSKILYQDAYYLFIYEGRIDFIGRFLNDPLKYWVDHKSESQKEDLNPDSFQFLGYSWALNTSSGLINYIGFQESKSPADAFRRTIVNHPKALIEDWKERAIHIYFRIARTHDQNYYEKNRNQCKPYKCRPCDFNEVCHNTNPRMISALLSKNFVVRKSPWRAWD
jgi:hypothetical protein